MAPHGAFIEWNGVMISARRCRGKLDSVPREQIMAPPSVFQDELAGGSGLDLIVVGDLESHGRVWPFVQISLQAERTR